MSLYTNVTVTHGSTTVATGATANIIEDSAEAQLWALGSAPLAKGETYVLTENGRLDWEGQFNGNGQGTSASPFILDVTGSVSAAVPTAETGTNLGQVVATLLAQAMSNAVTAQAMINKVGIEAMRQALALGLAPKPELPSSGSSRPSGPSAAKTETPSGASTGKTETPSRASAAKSVQTSSSSTPVDATLEWVVAFANGIAVIDRATIQHMVEVIDTILPVEPTQTVLSG